MAINCLFIIEKAQLIVNIKLKHNSLDLFDCSYLYTLREESSQTNVISQYKLLAAILSAVCSVIQQS